MPRSMHTLSTYTVTCNGLTDLYIFSECVEDLFGYFDGLGEVVLAMYINHILP